MNYSSQLNSQLINLIREKKKKKKKKMSNGGGSSSSRRWCPTPEQLMVLEELYRRGLRTPSASQIQRITAHLSLYGSIQGKSVFYWFQNHKARHRHKLRLLHHHFPLLHHQGSSSSSGGVMWQTPPPADPSKDNWLMQTYGYDSAMINAGATPTPAPNWWRPLQTLELFPLSPPSAANQQQT